MSTVVDRYVIELDGDQAAVIAESEETARMLRDRLASGGPIRVRVALRDADDTEAHALTAETVPITILLEDDVEGHALSVRFPSAGAARDFEKRLVATGLLVGVVAASAVGIGVTQGLDRTTPAGAVAPIVQTAPTRDMDKELAPIVQTAPTRDMDKELAPIVQTAPTRDMDKELAPALQVDTSAATRDMDKELAPIVQQAPAGRAIAE
jgi:hypothetical protein